MRRYFFFCLIILCSFSGDPFINPTGTYKLEYPKNKPAGTKFSYTGEIQIKLLTDSKIAMIFWVCKGPPSYNSGSFSDTLEYQDNKAIYTDPESDSTCRITFTVSGKRLSVAEQTDDINSGCGFGHAVVADGLIFKKISSKVPEMKEEGIVK